VSAVGSEGHREVSLQGGPDECDHLVVGQGGERRKLEDVASRDEPDCLGGRDRGPWLCSVQFELVGEWKKYGSGDAFA
jgi:hypothetical protein